MAIGPVLVDCLMHGRSLAKGSQRVSEVRNLLRSWRARTRYGWVSLVGYLVRRGERAGVEDWLFHLKGKSRDMTWEELQNVLPARQLPCPETVANYSALDVDEIDFLRGPSRHMNEVPSRWS